MLVPHDLRRCRGFIKAGCSLHSFPFPSLLIILFTEGSRHHFKGGREPIRYIPTCFTNAQKPEHVEHVSAGSEDV